MINYEEYKKIADPIMAQIAETERKRRIEIEKIREELSELAKTVKPGNRRKIVELINDLDAFIFYDYF